MNTEVLTQPNMTFESIDTWQLPNHQPAIDIGYTTHLLDNTERIGARLCRDAIWHGQQCNWIGPSMEFIDARWQTVHRSLGPDLYAGTAGIALFLAELYRQRSLVTVKKTAYAALHHALANRSKMLPSVSAGYYCGLLGLAEITHRFARQFDDQQWHDSYLQITNELVSLGPDKQGVDVIMGSAGAIPALVALYQRTGNDALLGLATQHADLLLSGANNQPHGCSWDTLNTGEQHPHLTGYAHGAAGVSLALAEIYAVTGINAYGDAAKEGFAYENSHFDCQHQNWPDFRNLESLGISSDTTVCAVAWCHGAAGIGLSRLRAYQLLNDATLRSDAEAAIATTRKQLENYLQSPGFDFTYCHGAIGDAELLLLADEYLGVNQHREFVSQVLAWAIDRYEQPGIEWPSGVPEAGESPSLFLGTAGIGHFMLRAAKPDEVNSVLLPGIS